jgi:hypothetical protein
MELSFEKDLLLFKLLEAVSKPDCRYFNGREFAFV